MAHFIEVQDEEGPGRTVNLDHIAAVMEGYFGNPHKVVLSNGDVIPFKKPNYATVSGQLLRRD